MPTGLQTTLNGVTIAGITYYGVVDLEDVFHARGTATPAANAGFKTADGRDTSDWFYPLSAGGTALEVDTSLRSAATDLRQIYAKKGTVGGGGPGGGGGCLPFETPILLWDGGWKQLGELRPGDVVIGCYVDGMLDATEPRWQDWSAPEEAVASSTFVPATVITVMLSSYPSHYIINGTARATFEHPFFVLRDGRWIWSRAEHLRPGDRMLDDALQELIVESVEHVDCPMRVANINVETVDNYFAQVFPERSVLTHNAEEKG